MSCENFLMLIYDLVDGEILPEDEILLKKHLENCADCQNKLKSIEVAEKRYKKEVLINPTPNKDFVNTITKQVLEKKNVVALPTKKPTSTTKRIIYYLGTIAASFAAFIYIAGSLTSFNQLPTGETPAFKSLPDNNAPLDMSFGQIIEIKNTFLGFLGIINSISQSSLIKDLAIILFLFSLQFTISYLFAQNKAKHKKPK